MKSLTVFLCLFSTSVFASEGGTRQVLSMLRSNSVVSAAVAQAKKYSGAKSCVYNVASKEAVGFEKGTTFDYTARIICTGADTDEVGGGQGLIDVKGRLSGGGDLQELDLAIRFAG
jgi:hypothetical protein